MLHAAVLSNAASLVKLRAHSPMYHAFDVDEVRALLIAAPSLQQFELRVRCFNMQETRGLQEARAMLRNEAPYGSVRLRDIHLFDPVSWTSGQAGVTVFCADLRRHVSLEGLSLACAPVHTAEAMSALVDACIALRLRSLRLINCELQRAVLPVLTRLVAAGALRELYISSISDEDLFAADADTQLFCTAVRASEMTNFVLQMPLPYPPVEINWLADFINARQ